MALLNTIKKIIQESKEREALELTQQEAPIDIENLDYLEEKKQLATTITQKDSKAQDAKEEFSKNFKAIENIILHSNKLDKLETDLKKEERKNLNPLEKREEDITQEIDNLEKAFDNLVKVTDISEMLRALYILDRALYEIGEKNKEENKMIKILKEAKDKGEVFTKDLAIKAFKEIKECYNKLDSFQNIRKIEEEYKSKIANDTLSYKATLSPKQKELTSKRIQDHLAYVEKELPNFKKHHPQTYENAREVLRDTQNLKQERTL